MENYLLHDLLTNSSSRYPDNKAVVLKDESITYRDLEIKSNQLALALMQRGITTGERVGIMLNKSIESIVSLFGILKAGAVYVPIDPALPTSRLEYIIRNCEIEMLITSLNHIKKIVFDSHPVLPLKKIFITGSKFEEINEISKNIEFVPWWKIYDLKTEGYRNVHMSDVNPAYILHTSGSTGSPKGVIISHLNALTFVNMASGFFEIRSDDRFSGHAPLHFDLSVFDIFVAIKCGATVVLVPEFLSAFPINLGKYIDEQRISIWNSVSSVLIMLADRGKLERLSLDSLRMVHFSGDVLPVKYLRMLKNYMRKATFYNIYGQTEANSSMCYQVNNIPDDEKWKIPIGRPFPNFESFALDENGSDVRNPGEEGELYVKSATVALGYWRKESETNDSFMLDPREHYCKARVYKTGDLVRLDDDGNFCFVGRKDHMVKSRGYRIELNEIETVISNHPFVRQAAVMAIPDESIGNKVIAFVSVIDEKQLAINDLLNFCRASLPKYMIPEIVEFRDYLPITSHGKIDRNSLIEEVSSKYI